MQLMLQLGIMVMIVFCGILTFLSIHITTRKNEGMIQAQIEASKIKRTDHVNTLSYDALLKIINDIIGFYISDYILIKGLLIKSDDEMSIIIDNVLVDICSSVYSAMSVELRQAMLNYVTEDHLKLLIKDNCRIVIIHKLQPQKEKITQ